MNDLFSLDGKTVAITGGYGHLGSSISEGIASAGAQVFVLGRSTEKHENCFKRKSNIHFVKCDISSTESIQSAFNTIVEDYNKIDVLINNAFYGKGGEVDNMSDEAWSFTIDGSLNSVHRCIREVLPHFRKNKGGRIINVSSMYGMVAPDFDVYQEYPQFTNPPHYGAGKAGVIQLTKYFASLLGKENILVNAVSPGPFPSKLVQEEKGFVERLSKKNPLGRIGQPEELQGVFIFLSSNASSYVTGQNIAVDGGWTIL
jgi:gluconate 5-dehydrogenase